MNKTVLRIKGFSLALAIMLLGSVFIISSCGSGGGGGGGGVSPVTYDGLKTQATVSSTNANAIFSVVWNGGSSSIAASPAKASSAKALNAVGSDALFKQMTDRIVSDAAGYAARSKALMTAIPVNDSYDGSVSGRVTVTGSMDSNTFTGTLTFTFTNFNDGTGFTADGTVKFRVDSFNSYYGIITDGTMSFTLWTVKTATSNISISGSIRVQQQEQSDWSGSETMTVNVSGRDNNTGDTFRFENFVEIVYLDDVQFPTMATETVSGRAYIKEYGYVDVTTTVSLHYSSASQENPDSGTIILTGLIDSHATVTVNSTLDVTIGVDANNDGADEFMATYAWSNLAGAPL